MNDIPILPIIYTHKLVEMMQEEIKLIGDEKQPRQCGSCTACHTEYQQKEKQHGAI